MSTPTVDFTLPLRELNPDRDLSKTRRPAGDPIGLLNLEPKESCLNGGGRPTELAKFQLAGLLLLQVARREDRNRLLKEPDELGMKH